MSSLPLMQLRVSKTESAARGIQRIELRHPLGDLLPSFTAGAHIPVRTPSGAMRRYSLCNDPGENDRYVIAVKREDHGRGGSRSLVDSATPGLVLDVGSPENLFALDPKASSFVLIAGGIGITPMMAMARHLLGEDERPFNLYYLTRDEAVSAFIEELRSPPFAPHVVIHHDGGDPERTFDLWPVLEKPGSVTGRHVYCCGPTPLMDAVRDMSGHWPSSTVHFESFGADLKPHEDDQPFEVQLQRSGTVFTVPIGQSILETLREQGVHVPSSCESGTCGSCKTRLIEGEPDHRDLVLMQEERNDYVMVCVSRAKSPRLVPDL